MNSAQLSTVTVSIFMGGIHIQRVPRLILRSTRFDPLQVANIVVPDPRGELHRFVKAGMRVDISIGMRGFQPEIWSGEVSGIGSGATKDQIFIIAKRGLELVQPCIKESFENETPEAVMRWAILQAGLTADVIDYVGVVLPRISVANLSLNELALQLGHSCKHGFAVDMSHRALWLGAGGVCWSDGKVPGSIPVISTGEDLIKHTPLENYAYGLGLVETFLLPEFGHSRMFRIVDSRRGIDASFRALGVEHHISPNKARTFIEYGEEYEHY
ncbi:MAG: hypothetical protein ACNI27_07185 [Desulfovibrio sp.]